MNEHDQSAATENPFCSRRVRPGALPFLFAPGQDAARLVDRLSRHGWWGQIVGPHGSGKSALLAALVPAIGRAGRRVLRVQLHDRQRRLPHDWKRVPDLDRSAVLTVDGYEQLGLWARVSLKRSCRRRGAGLLVTAHAPVGLPELFHATVNLELAQRIVVQLQRDHRPHITPGDVASRFAHHAGNMREILFELYDLYEKRQGATEGARRRGLRA